ncbi:MAG: hypothetical protein ACK4NF_05765 [Planctomycetota bacterium]
MPTYTDMGYKRKIYRKGGETNFRVVGKCVIEKRKRGSSNLMDGNYDLGGV